MYDYSKLKGRIVEICGNQRNFAQLLGRQESYVSRVLNGSSFLNQIDIDNWARILKIDDNDISSYFFARQIDETQIAM